MAPERQRQECHSVRKQRRSSRKRKPNTRYPKLIIDNSLVIVPDTQDDNSVPDLQDTQDSSVPDSQDAQDSSVPDSQDTQVTVDDSVPNTQDTQITPDDNFPKLIIDNSLVIVSDSQVTPDDNFVPDNRLMDDSVFVPETQDPATSTESVPDTVIPESQKSQADLFNMTLVSEDGSSDESSVSLLDVDSHLPVNDSVKHYNQVNDTTAPVVPIASSATSLALDVSSIEPIGLDTNYGEPSDPSADIVDPPTTFADVGSPIKTVAPVVTRETLHLFRGPKNPLSAFYPQKLLWKNVSFISAEQAYQYEKLLFHRVPRSGRNRLLKCHNSHDVKRIANELVRTPCDSWNAIKFSLMSEICELKVRQCKRFRDCLVQTGSSTLIHNTETDSEWGCGIDMNGRNMMGKILMEVRDNIQTYEQEYPPLPKPSVPLHKPTSPPDIKANCIGNPAHVIIIGNSNTRGLAQEINARGLDCTGFVYPGQTAADIKNRVEKIVTPIPPAAIVCHAGDIEVRDHHHSVESLKKDYTSLIDNIRTTFPRSKIILSGLPPVRSSRDSSLRMRIQEVNRHLTSLTTSIENCVFLSNAKSTLRDNIHFTNQSKVFLSRSIACHVKQCL